MSPPVSLPDDEGVVVTLVVLAGGGIGAVGIAVGLLLARGGRRTRPQPEAQIERPDGVLAGVCAGPCLVMHVIDRRYPRQRALAPYYIAHCECDWTGPAHDDITGAARELAIADAFRHSANVEPTVGRPVD